MANDSCGSLFTVLQDASNPQAISVGATVDVVGIFGAASLDIAGSSHYYY
jgi:hypothetical protein